MVGVIELLSARNKQECGMESIEPRGRGGETWVHKTKDFQKQENLILNLYDLHFCDVNSSTLSSFQEGLISSLFGEQVIEIKLKLD